MPLIVTADSSILLGGEWWVEKASTATRAQRARGRTCGAYLGAANGDEPAYFQMAMIAFERAGLEQSACRHVKADSELSDRSFVAERAAVVILAGGDPLLAEDAFAASGMNDAILCAARAGALIVGTSAGAIHMGLFGAPESVSLVAGHSPAQPLVPNLCNALCKSLGGSMHNPLFRTLGLLPFAFGAHEEASDWANFLAMLAMACECDVAVAGIGLPFSSAIIFDGDIAEIACQTSRVLKEPILFSEAGAARRPLQLGSQWKLSRPRDGAAASLLPI